MGTKNLAVIGFGGRGHIYGEFARKYPEKFKLKAVAETDEYRRRDAKENFGSEVYEDYKELLDQGYQPRLSGDSDAGRPAQGTRPVRFE